MNIRLLKKLSLLESEKHFEILKDSATVFIRGGSNCQKLQSCGTFSSKTKVKNPNPVLVSCSNYTLNGKKISF